MKYIIIILVVLLLAVGGYFLASRYLKNAKSNIVNPPPTGGTATKTTITPLDPATIPAGEKISLGTDHGTVDVNNFYKVAAGFEGDALILRSAPQYKIIYNTETSAFGIYIIAAPIDASRAAAEKDLVGILRVSEQEICYLNASWSVSPGASGKLSGIARKLSFCP